MSAPGNSVFDPKREELFHVAGDKDHGFSTTARLDKNKQEVSVRYKDLLMTVDIYELPNEPTRIVLLCPKCRNSLSITADRKQISFEPQVMKEHGGRLNVETFQCTWEADPHGRRMEFGLGLCGWRAAIDNNIAKDA